MSSIKVSALSAKTSPAGTEELLINDSGTSKKITIANLPDTDTVYTHPNHSGDIVSSADGATTIQVDAVDIAMLSATGTASSTTFLRGDNTWVVPTDTDTNTNQLTTFTVSATTDTNATTISQGDDLMFTAGTGITCETTADGTVTITNTVTDTDTVYTHPNHSGEVTSTGDGATVVADNVVDEANLKVSNTPTNGYVLTAQSAASGGLTWAADSTTDSTKLPLAGGTLTGNLNLGDNVKAQFGAGNDLQLYHTGTHSYIDDVGDGNLNIRGTNLYLANSTGDYFIRCFSGDWVGLYHNNALKLATTSTGIDVTGSVTTDSLVVQGGITETEATSSASTYTIDLANGTLFEVTHATLCTVTMPTAAAGKSFTVISTVPAAWSGTILWSGGAAPTTGSAKTIYSFISNGSSWYGMQAGTGFA